MHGHPVVRALLFLVIAKNGDCLKNNKKEHFAAK